MMQWSNNLFYKGGKRARGRQGECNDTIYTLEDVKWDK